MPKKLPTFATEKNTKSIYKNGDNNLNFEAHFWKE